MVQAFKFRHPYILFLANFFKFLSQNGGDKPQKTSFLLFLLQFLEINLNKIHVAVPNFMTKQNIAKFQNGKLI